MLYMFTTSKGAAEVNDQGGLIETAAEHKFTK